MKIAVVVLVLLATPASAESLLVEACKRAYAIHLMDDKVKIPEVYDFSNLKPPRVRTTESLFGDTVECKFTSTTKPVGLREFCPPSIFCLKPGHERFDEIVEMLKREGY